MAETLRLPRADGTLTSYHLAGATPVTSPAGPIRSRIAYAAVHVVADPLAAINPTLEAALDWDATLAYRRYIWSLGLAVAEAMDTSQRGMGFDWSTAKELIRRAVAEARGIPGAVIASGAGTDHLEPGQRVALADVEAAYEEQCAFIESVGGRIILMASRALAACAKGGDDYAKVYGKLLEQVSEPVIIHWLGEMFDPALAGYWGSADLDGGDLARYGAILAPTLPLSRHVFGAPTRFYKTGVVFAAYLNGHQSGFKMVGGMESARSVVHLAEQFVLMDAAGLLRDPDLAADRMRRVLAVSGVD